MSSDRKRLIKIALEEDRAMRRSEEVEHEPAVSLFNLLAENVFDLVAAAAGPYCLLIGIRESRLVLEVRNGDENSIEEIILPLFPLRSLIRDYFKVCDAYYKAIKTASPSRIEAIDMGRRGIHDEDAEILLRRLAPKIEMDTQTSRRLFILIFVLQVRDWRE